MANKAEAVLMPEITLYNTLKTFFNSIQKDFEEAENEEDSLLYRIFAKDSCNNDVKFENFNYYEQAVQTFIKKTPEVNLGYNMEVSAMGSVHILLPQESGKPMALGADENYQPNIINDDGTGYTPVFTQGFTSTYNLMISSENTFEVILIYNIMKAGLISLNAHLELSGLQTPRLGGSDVTMQNDLIPPHIFHRSLTINFSYDVNIPGFFARKIIKKFTAEGTPIEE